MPPLPLPPHGGALPPRSVPHLGVAGVGNPLKGDDGVGTALIQRLATAQWGGWLADLGTDLLGIQNRQPYPRQLLLVDAVRSGALPGSLHRLGRCPAREALPPPAPLSAHGISVLQELTLLERLDPAFRRVQWCWIGVEYADLETPFRLSPEVEAAVERLARWLEGREPCPLEGWCGFPAS